MVYNRKFSRAQAGFTLIEILVVISIVGILVSIVLFSLGGSRNSSKDARIRADMTQLNALAEVLYVGGYPSTLKTPYGTAGCTVQTGLDPTVQELGADIKAQNGATSCAVASNGALWINNGTSAYAATAKLNDGTFWCIDSIGISRGGYATQGAALSSVADYTCN